MPVSYRFEQLTGGRQPYWFNCCLLKDLNATLLADPAGTCTGERFDCKHHPLLQHNPPLKRDVWDARGGMNRVPGKAGTGEIRNGMISPHLDLMLDCPSKVPGCNPWSDNLYCLCECSL